MRNPFELQVNINETSQDKFRICYSNDLKISVLQTTNINFSFIIHVQCELPRVLAQCTYSGPILVEIPLNTKIQNFCSRGRAGLESCASA